MSREQKPGWAAVRYQVAESKLPNQKQVLRFLETDLPNQLRETVEVRDEGQLEASRVRQDPRSSEQSCYLSFPMCHELQTVQALR